MDSKVVIVIVLAVFVIVLQNLKTRYYDYKCSICGERFSLSTIKLIFSIHMLGKKLVRCPKCGKWNWAEIVPKK